MPLSNLFTRKKKPLSARPPTAEIVELNFTAHGNNPMTRSNIKPKFDALFAANRATNIGKLMTAVQPILELYKTPDGPETLELYFDRERSPSRNILRKFSEEDLASLKMFAKGRTIYNNNNAMGGVRRSRRTNRKNRKSRRANRR
jgi:hypothetical protein